MKNLDYMIEMSNVNKWYGDFHVLKDINSTFAHKTQLFLSESTYHCDNLK